jgi:acetyl esterase/lipase
MSTQDRPPLDADIAAMERRWQESGIPGLYDGRDGPVSRERARNVRALLYPKPKLPTGRIERATIPGPGGEIPVEIVHPVEGAPIGTLVYFHGGGYVLGDLESHQAHAIRFANQSQVLVMNVDYRLAPEHPFPAGVSDAVASTKWAAANLDRLGGAGKPLAVGGDSAGGNFAAVSAVRARDAGIALAAQVLLYGAYGAAERSSEVTPNGGGLDVPMMYYGSMERMAASRTMVEAAPAVADLRGVAPAIIAVGPYDFLYRDNVAYAAKLREAGVRVVYREYPTLNHGFFSYAAISPASRRAADEVCADLKAMLG